MTLTPIPGMHIKPKPAPAPPPFPPASTWFLGIKPLNQVAGWGNSKFDSSKPRPYDMIASMEWSRTAQKVFSGSIMSFVKYQEFCLPRHRRRQLMFDPRDDPFMHGLDME